MTLSIAMSQQDEITKKVSLLPRKPGVYLFKDDAGHVIYIGKAKELRSRVRSYFRPSTDTRHSIQFIVKKTADLEYILTDTEKEALLLENTLIKKHQPRFNVRLRDDKTYVSLKLNVKHEFPRLEITRRWEKDGSLYFGPYSSARSVRETMRVIARLFPLRTCRDSVLYNRKRPCLMYQIGQCPAPCVGYCSEEEYRPIVEETILFLKGRNKELLERLNDRMIKEAEALRFEDAARIRDQIRAIERTLEKQKTALTSRIDQDVMGVYREGGAVEVAVLFFREGKLLGNRTYQFKRQYLSDEEWLAGFLGQFYEDARVIPQEVLLPYSAGDTEALEEWLSERRGTRVRVLVPERGEKRRLVEMAQTNAQHSFTSRKEMELRDDDILESLRERLRLDKKPARIECFDISNIHGRLAVGSMVSFENGRPNKSAYRRYKIKTVSDADDFGMMHEVLTRRVRRGKEEGNLPDLIVVDGGKGQLNVARRVVSEQGIKGVDLIGLAKSRTQKEELGKSRSRPVEKSGERVFLPNVKDSIRLREDDPATFLLQRIRDESHRFAIEYHRKLRKKTGLRSILTDIPGVGEKRKKALLRHFGGVTRIRQASPEELAAVPGITTRVAKEIQEYLVEPGTSQPL